MRLEYFSRYNYNFKLGILVDKKLNFILNIVINETSIFDKVRK